MSLIDKILGRGGKSRYCKLYHRRRKDGICIYCKKECGESYACESCKKKRNQYYKNWKKRRK